MFLSNNITVCLLCVIYFVPLTGGHLIKLWPYVEEGYCWDYQNIL